MEVYTRYFKVTKGPLIDAILEHRAITTKAYNEYEELAREIGANPDKFYIHHGRLIGFVFAGIPTSVALRETAHGWVPRLSTREGKTLAARIKAIRTSNLQECLRSVYLYSQTPRIFGGNRAYNTVMIDIPSDPPVALIKLPWYDEAPEKLAQYKIDRAAFTHLSSNLDALLWEPTPDMEEIKQWEFLKVVEDWNDSVRAGA